MEAITIPIEYQSDTPELDDELKEKTEKRLHKLTRRHRDITRVMISVKTTSGNTQPRDYRVSVNVSRKPDDANATGSGATVNKALSDALAAVERQVRQQREKLRQRRKRT